MKLPTYTKSGQLSKTPIIANENLFKGEVNKKLLAQAVRVYLSNQRQGTSQVKTRSAVVRTKRKWYSQKGTGNARHGSRNAPIFVGGGVAHGPTGLENWTLKITKRLKNLALISALRAQKDNVLVCTGLSSLTGKTKEGVALIKKMVDLKTNILIVLDQMDDKITRSFSNIQKVYITQASQLNIYDVAMADKIIFSKASLLELENRLEKYLKPKVKK
jgi:large subunit ribosomal protein L4